MLGFIVFGVAAYLFDFRYTYLVCAISSAIAFALLMLFDRNNTIERYKEC